jgi:hypothetical protein
LFHPYRDEFSHLPGLGETKSLKPLLDTVRHQRSGFLVRGSSGKTIIKIRGVPEDEALSPCFRAVFPDYMKVLAREFL